MKKLKELIQDYITKEKLAPGISVALLKNGKCIHKETNGYANLENKVKIDTNTNFYLASVSKTFTAAAIMLMKQKKILDINDDIITYFPNLPNCYKKIKITNLLDHTAGLKDYFLYFLEQGNLYDITNEDVLQYLKGEPSLEFACGSKFNYCNTGYVLLAQIIEKVTGSSYSHFLKENFFLPLRMKNTFVFTENKPVIPHRAYGYKKVDNKYFCDDYRILTTGDGGIYSNVNDLLKWENAFSTNKIFTQKTIQDIYKLQNITSKDKTRYSNGWNIRKIDEKSIVYHDGAGFGFRTFLGRIIETNFTLIILTSCCKDMWQELYKRCSKIMLELDNEISQEKTQRRY